MSNEEQAVALRVLRVFIQGDEVSYKIVGASDKQGSTSFHETLTTKFKLLAKNDSLESTSWDQLPEIAAQQKAPEELTATFDRFEKKQQADFSKILEEQKLALLKEFEQQLSTIPLFAQND
jgi:hypothetical protein